MEVTLVTQIAGSTAGHIVAAIVALLGVLYLADRWGL
jgi:hypothetical protein